MEGRGGAIDGARLMRQDLFLGGLPGEISFDTLGSFERAFAGCIHLFVVENVHTTSSDRSDRRNERERTKRQSY